MDKFEKHIRDNREHFERHKPNREKMWAGIEQALPESSAKRVPLWRRKSWRIAAAILFLVGCTGISFTAFMKNSNATAQQIPTEILEINMHYSQLVNSQLEKINQNSELTSEEKNEFINYIEELNLENESLMAELKNNLDNQQVLQAIITNYKNQIEVIERVLLRLHSTKKENNDEGISI